MMFMIPTPPTNRLSPPMTIISTFAAELHPLGLFNELERDDQRHVVRITMSDFDQPLDLVRHRPHVVLRRHLHDHLADLDPGPLAAARGDGLTHVPEPRDRAGHRHMDVVVQVPPHQRRSRTPGQPDPPQHAHHLERLALDQQALADRVAQGGRAPRRPRPRGRQSCATAGRRRRSGNAHARPEAPRRPGGPASCRTPAPGRWSRPRLPGRRSA